MPKTIAKLYKLTQTGSTQFWEIQVEGNKYRSLAGKVGGKTITSEWTICEGKSLGQSNETTPSEQALREAEAKAKKKLESGYGKDVAKAGRPEYFEPMLAQKWEDRKDDLKYPVLIQPKLDGIRCVVSKDGMFTRNGKAIVSAPHIFGSLTGFFKKNPTIVLDGELYNHKLKYDFNKIVSLVKKTKPSAEELNESAKMVEYHVYDVFDYDRANMTFVTRTNMLACILDEMKNPYLVRVETGTCISEDRVDAYHEKYLGEGFEGSIIREPLSKYEHKRAKCLLKRKDFMDAEYKILDVVEGEGNRTGMVGYMNFQTEDGKPFKSNVKGDFDFLASCLKDRKTLIGKKATIKFFSLTPDGIPRFPYVIAIRDYD